MYYTSSIEKLGAALVDLMGFFASPQRDQLLLRTAGVDLDRALFPLLIRLAGGPRSVAGLAADVGRDHTTVSRQLAKLETRGLVTREKSEVDQRLRAARIAPPGEDMVKAILQARRRLLGRALADWSETDLDALAALNTRFIGALRRAAVARDSTLG